ncbi:unnamed protein product [Hydatigera taeniaeformis]|uniref:Uncharacterized protein n=1 Tax=Hydatigena taeniaeformis TaxID=6205 RepID=A0A0R3WWP9_HYDTA|nr:unnamed protein product [Hydatigera taeniaeformis]
MDPLCADLPLKGFTWTRWGHFPEAVNTSLLNELCTRLCRTGAATTTTLSPRMTVTRMGMREDESIFRLVDDTDVTLGDGEDFCPSPHYVSPPLPFIHGNGVPEALGVAQLNSLLKRTVQETTDCLIAGQFCMTIKCPTSLGVILCYKVSAFKVTLIDSFAAVATATKRRNAGGAAWAEQLLSEVYSLWFLLLPAFIASLQQHSGGLNVGDGIGLETRRFLYRVVGVFLRLWESPVQPVDQVYVRVLIALLYEYGTSDEGVISFWSSRPLNAPSYAMANQLQRDLGHKLTSARTMEDGSESSTGNVNYSNSRRCGSFL